MGITGEILDTNIEEVSRALDVNIKGPIAMVQAVVPHMPRGGRVINITSTASRLGWEGLPVYGATKAGLDLLTWSWAREVRTDNPVMSNIY